MSKEAEVKATTGYAKVHTHNPGKHPEVKPSEGARKRSGKDVEPLSRTEGGSARHNGREIPKPTRSVDLTDEVCDLSPSGDKK
jgi:hypothetical protein